MDSKEIKKQLISVKESIHAGVEIDLSMDKLLKVVEQSYDDDEERNIMAKMVATTKKSLQDGHPIDTFDITYSNIVFSLLKSEKI